MKRFDLGPYCLQYRLPKNIKQMRDHRTKEVTSGLRFINEIVSTEMTRNHLIYHMTSHLGVI